MTIQRRYHLGHLTALSLPPRELVPLAAAAGYDAVSIRMLASTPGGPEYPLPPGSSDLREVRQMLRDGGIGVHEIEALQLNEDFDVERFQHLLEAASELNARSLLVVSNDSQLSRVSESFARLCEAAAPYSLDVDLEFIPTKGVATARDALQVVGSAGQPNGGVLVDAIHVARTDSPLSDIAAIPQSMLHFWQICDAPAKAPATVADVLKAGRHERLLPGEGGLDLAGLAALMPASLPICVEIPTTTRANLGHTKWIALALERCRAIMANMDTANQTASAT